MDDDDLRRFEQKLLALRSKLQALEQVSVEAKKPVELDQSRVGRLSRMDALQGQQMAQEAARRRQQQMRMIAAALRRIGEKEYGYCSVCGGEIGVRRLEFDPAAARCIKCAE